MRIQQLALLALPATLCLSGVASAQTGLTPVSLKIARVAEADTFTLIEDEDTDGTPAVSEPGAEAVGKKEESKDRESLVTQLTKSVREIRIDTDPGAKAPEDRTSQLGEHSELWITREVFTFQSPMRYSVCSCHNPLYFEEPDLERCGNTHCIFTTKLSALHFASNTLLLPYRLVTQPPCETQCALGDCRCCEEMPCQTPLRCRLSGILSESAAAAGFVFLLL